MPWIIGFRHYFGDLKIVSKWQQHTVFCDFFLSKNHMNGWFLRNTLCFWFDRKSFTNSNINLKLNRIGSFRFIYRKYTYEVVPIYWSILTLDSCPWEINQYFLLELHRVLFTSQHSKNGGSSRTEQTMSSQEHFHSYII